MKDQSDLNYIPARQNENDKALTHLSAHGINVPVKKISHERYHDQESISCVAASVCGKYLLFGFGNLVKLWDIDKDRIVKIFKCNSLVTSVDFSPNNKFFFAGCSDRSVRTINIDSGKEESILDPVDYYKHYPTIRYIFHFDVFGECDLVFVEITLKNLNRIVEVWNYSTREIKQIYRSESLFDLNISASPDGQYLLVVEEKIVILINAQTGSLIQTFETGKKLFVFPIFSPNGKYISTNSDKAIIWELKTGNVIKAFGMEKGSKIKSTTFSPDGNSLLTISDDSNVTLWNIQTGNSIKLFEINDSAIYHKAIFSPCGGKIILYNHSEILIWDFNIPGKLTRYNKPVSSNKIVGVEFSKKKRSVFIGGINNTITLLDLTTGRIIKKIDTYPNGHAVLCLSPDENYLATAIGAVATLIHAQTFELIETFDNIYWTGQIANFSSDSKFLSIGLQNGWALIWNIKTKKIIKKFKNCNAAITSVAFKPCGKYLLTGSSDRIVRIWDIEKEIVTHSINCDLNVTKIQFSDDGKLVLMRGDLTSRLYEASTYRVLGTYDLVEDGIVSACALNLSGEYVLSANKEGIGTLYEIKNRKIVQIFKKGNEKFRAVYFLPNDRTIASRHDDQSAICFWDKGTANLLATFYLLKKGFLWVTPPDEVAMHGWFWTDRPELISVAKSLEDINGLSILTENDHLRKSYIETYNRQDIVMSRLNNFEVYQKEIGRILGLRKQKENLTFIDMKLNHVKQIEQNAR